MSQLQLIIVLAVCLFVAWIFFEFKRQRAVRILLGMSCVAIITFGWTLHSMRTAIIDSHEWLHLNASMTRLEQLIEQGDVSGAAAAVAVYNATLDSTGDPYTASTAMWQSFPVTRTQP